MPCLIDCNKVDNETIGPSWWEPWNHSWILSSRGEPSCWSARPENHSIITAALPTIGGFGSWQFSVITLGEILQNMFLPEASLLLPAAPLETQRYLEATTKSQLLSSMKIGNGAFIPKQLWSLVHPLPSRQVAPHWLFQEVRAQFFLHQWRKWISLTHEAWAYCCLGYPLLQGSLPIAQVFQSWFLKLTWPFSLSPGNPTLE